MNNITIIFALPNMASGGAERVVSILANNIVTHHLSVKVWLYYGTTIHYDLDPKVCVDSLNFGHLSVLQRIHQLRIKLKDVKASCNNVIFIPFLTSILNISIVAKIGLGIPIIACERNNPYVKGEKGWKRFLVELPFRFAQHCIFQTQEARLYYSHVPDRKCSIVINPVNQSDYLWEGKLDYEHLVSVCRMHEQKNLPMTLDVIETLKQNEGNVHLSIYGEGELKDYIEKEIQRRGLSLNISLMGVTKSITKVLSQSSVFMSTSNYEGISNSMLEAMSVGMPIICTDCPIGGARLLLKDGAGVLVPVNDRETFTKELEQLINDSQKSRLMAATARNTALKYTPVCISNQWLSIIKSLLR